MKPRWLPLIILALSLISCDNAFDYDDYESRVEYFRNIRGSAYLAPDSLLTVVTWNIKVAFGNTGDDPWSDDIGGTPELLAALSQVLHTLDPDIILLQEVPYNRENTVIKAVLDTIGVNINYNYAFGGHGFNSNGTYPTRAQWGTAILSKFEITEIENREVFNLNDIWSRRSVLRALLKVGEADYLNAYSLHFSHDAPSVEVARSQSYKTRDFHQESQYPVVVGGDFNDSNSIDPIIGLINCSPPDYDDIDKIYVSDEFDIIMYYTQDEESLKYSDHYAGMVKVKLNLKQ